jgi:iron only hydrogenase large subunit-like protein
MKDRDYTHAVQIDTGKCVGCSHCMQVCPTQAIRIAEGHAGIIPERCVDCGECYRVCPVKAVDVEDDGLPAINRDGYRVALVPSVFIGQFPSEHTASEIMEAVRQIGFDEVLEVEQAVDFMKGVYAEVAAKEDIAVRPVISSFCPAIVRLIQVQYPSLTGQILPIKAPHDIAALYVRRSKAKAGVDPRSIFICYITPCAAKIVAAKAPVGEKISAIDGVIDMKEVYNLVSMRLMERKDTQLSKQYANMSPDSVNWSLSGTEKRYFPGRALAIDGMENAMEFLDRLAPDTPLIVLAEIDEMFSNRLKLGQSCEIRVAGNPQPVAHGKLIVISPDLKSKSLFSDSGEDFQDRRVREIEVSIDNDSGLLIDTKVECIVHLN